MDRKRGGEREKTKPNIPFRPGAKTESGKKNNKNRGSRTVKRKGAKGKGGHDRTLSSFHPISKRGPCESKRRLKGRERKERKKGKRGIK